MTIRNEPLRSSCHEARCRSEAPLHRVTHFLWSCSSQTNGLSLFGIFWYNLEVTAPPITASRPAPAGCKTAPNPDIPTTMLHGWNAILFQCFCPSICPKCFSCPPIHHKPKTGRFYFCLVHRTAPLCRPAYTTLVLHFFKARWRTFWTSGKKQNDVKLPLLVHWLSNHVLMEATVFRNGFPPIFSLMGMGNSISETAGSSQFYLYVYICVFFIIIKSSLKLTPATCSFKETLYVLPV